MNSSIHVIESIGLEGMGFLWLVLGYAEGLQLNLTNYIVIHQTKHNQRGDVSSFPK